MGKKYPYGAGVGVEVGVGLGVGENHSGVGEGVGVPQATKREMTAASAILPSNIPASIKVSLTPISRRVDPCDPTSQAYIELF